MNDKTTMPKLQGNLGQECRLQHSIRSPPKRLLLLVMVKGCSPCQLLTNSKMPVLQSS